ncbi:MAG: N-acetyltransferase family protein [Deltaproteobacteria bacterium]
MERNITIRNGTPEDFEKVIEVMPGWWNGRDLTGMVLKLFFVHFRDTIFIAEANGEMVGFLMGILSQYHPDQAYIQFIGIRPGWRNRGLGRMLAGRFFDVCRKNGRTIIKSSTAPINTESIAFHTRLGFDIEPGDGKVSGFPVVMDYHRKNDPKVSFIKVLE